MTGVIYNNRTNLPYLMSGTVMELSAILVARITCGCACVYNTIRVSPFNLDQKPFSSHPEGAGTPCTVHQVTLTNAEEELTTWTSMHNLHVNNSHF